MGDNLQVTPVFEVLKQSDPTAEVWVLTEKGFENVFKGNPYLDRTVLFDRSLHTAAHFQSLAALRRNLDPALKELAATPFDLVVNRQSSAEGALLSQLVQCRDRRGYSLNASAGFAPLDPWTRLLFAMVGHRRIDPFQLIDYHIRSAGGRPGAVRPWIETDECAARGFFDGLGAKGNQTWIALQPGASTPWRQWPASCFAELGQNLLSASDSLHLILLHSASEAGLAKEIADKMPPQLQTRLHACDLPLRGLPALLRCCDLLITNDTGPMHIAAASQCRVLALYFAGSVANEVAPYGSGHLLLQAGLDCIPCREPQNCSKSFACRNLISPAAVSACALHMVGLLPRLREELFSRIHVLRTNLGQSGLQCFPLFRRPLDGNSVHRFLYRALFLEMLEGVPVAPGRLGKELNSFYTDSRSVVNSALDIDLGPVQKYCRTPQESAAATARLSRLIGEIRANL